MCVELNKSGQILLVIHKEVKMISPMTPVVLGHTPTRIPSTQESQTGGTIRFLGGRSNVGGAAVSHSPVWAQYASVSEHSRPVGLL